MKHYILIFTLLCSVYGFAQSRQISGNITDENGLPVPGASVLIKDSRRGTMTDFDGNFELGVNDGETLVVSFIGYLTREVAIDNRNTYSLSLIHI
jgi:hypothetical protein